MTAKETIQKSLEKGFGFMLSLDWETLCKLHYFVLSSHPAYKSSFETYRTEAKKHLSKFHLVGMIARDFAQNKNYID